MWPRIIPFAVYMGFIGLSPLLTGLFSSAQGGGNAERLGVSGEDGGGGRLTAVFLVAI